MQKFKHILKSIFCLSVSFFNGHHRPAVFCACYLCTRFPAGQ